MKENATKEVNEIQEKLKEDYWLKKLSRIEDIFNIPTEKVLLGNYDSLDIHIGPAITSRIKSIAMNSEINECIILLAALGILLYKYYRHPTFIISSPEVKENHGNISDNSPLFYRMEFIGSNSIKDVLQNTHLEFHESMAYKGYNYTRFKSIIRRKKIEEELLYQFGFFDHRIFKEYSAAENPLLQLRIVGNTNQKLHAQLKFRVDLFEISFCRQMLSHYQNILSYLEHDLDAELEKIVIISPVEKQHLLFELNRTTAGYPTDNSIHRLFEEQVYKDPHSIALSFDGESLKKNWQFTYKELNLSADRWAALLQAKGTGTNSIIALMLKPSIRMVMVILGILKSGGAYVPIATDNPEARASTILNDAHPKALLVDDESKVQGLLVLDVRNEPPENLPPQQLRCIHNPSDLAYIIYTSGSSGNPKGVMVEHRNVIRLMINDKHPFDFNHRDIWSMFHSYCFDFSVWEMYGALLYGGKLVIIPREIARDTNLFLTLLESRQVAVLNQIPSVFNNLASAALRGNEARKLSLRYVIFGGDALNPALLKNWHEVYSGIQLINMYGITETTVHVTYKKISAQEIEQGKSNIGGPIPTLTCYIMDKNLGIEPMGIPGEIVVGGEGVSRGYLNHPELTYDKFKINPYVKGERIYCSGDLGRRLFNGDIEFLGRIDNQVKIRGYRIECGEIERRLIGFGTIREAVVVGSEDKDGNKYLTAYITAREEIDGSECRAYLEKMLPNYMVPSFFQQLEKFPLTSSGKIDKRALPDPQPAGSKTGFEEPRTDLEKDLVKIWSEVLGIEKIGISDDFFSIGGNSIKGIHIANKIQEHLKETIHVAVLFEAPTIKELATKLETYNRVINSRIDGAAAARMREIVIPPPPMPEPVSAVKNPTTVFLLSAPRCGSTLLRVILAGHPKLFAPPELELMSFNTLQDRKRGLSGRFSYFLEGTLRAIMDLKNCSAEEAQIVMKEFEEQDLTVQQFYGIMQEWLGDRLLVDKTPYYSLDLEVLKRMEQYFENPKYLHLCRHPYSAIHSFEEAKLDQIFRYSHNFSVRELAELVWLTCNQNILDFLNEIPPQRKLTLKFEDLVQGPEEVAREISKFLGIEYCEEMIRIYENTSKKMTDGIHPESKMLGDINFFTHADIDSRVTEKWKKTYKTEFLGDITVNLAQSLGYLQQKTGPHYSQLEHAPEQEYYHLSNAQKRLWILAHREENKIAYNIPQVLLLEGNIELEMLTKAFETIIRRHESLRTLFIVAGGQPQQKILDFESLEFKLQYTDLRGKEDIDKETKVLVEKEIATSFDLHKGPLIRVKLFQLEERKYVFFFNLHHIICDGWSMNILVDELLILYEAYMEGSESPLIPLQFQYKDYAYWQNSTAGREAMKRQEAFWLEEFRDGVPILNLPTDFPRPPVQSFEGSAITFQLKEKQTKQILEYIQQEKITLFVLILSVYIVLLSKLSGQEDIVIGIGIAGRKHADLEKIIGMFVNTLAIRSYPARHKTFKNFLKEVNKKTLQAFENQDYPFEELVEKVAGQRSLNRNPLFDAAQSMEVNVVASDRTRPGLEELSLNVKPYSGIGNQTSVFDIMFNIGKVSDKLTISVGYCTKLFKKETIEMFTTYFGEIIPKVIENSEVLLKNINLSQNVQLTDTTVPQYDFEF